MPAVYVCPSGQGSGALLDYPYDFGDGRGFVQEVDQSRAEPNCTAGVDRWVELDDLLAEMQAAAGGGSTTGGTTGGTTGTTFDPSTIPADELAEAFAAGFLVIGGPLVFIWSARMVLRAFL